MDDALDIIPGPFERILRVPSSKSYSNRYLILAALYPGPVQIRNISLSTDVLHLIACFREIGLNVIVEKSSGMVIVENSFPECEALTSAQVITLHTGDGGTTNRFLVALLSRGKKRYRTIPQGSMLHRPMDPLLTALKQLHIQIESLSSDLYPLEIQGPPLFFKEKIEVFSDESSQFLSALSLAYYDQKIKFIPWDERLISEKYYLLTENIIKSFYYQHFKEYMVFDVPADFSSVSYPLALALTDGEVTIKNCLSIDLLQPDSAFFSIMKKANGKLELTRDGLKAWSSLHQMTPLKVSCLEFPDLVPTLVYMASCIPGESYLYDITNLNLKESPRLDVLKKILKAFHIKAHFTDSSIKIHGAPLDFQAPFVELNLPADHRMIMVGHLFMRHFSGGRLRPHFPVEKSFPHYFQEMGP
jgi:3-phosphoshikimate 1-carboxyvinyltransferase